WLVRRMRSEPVNCGGRHVKTRKSLARELVADAAHGVDERRAVAELLADRAHVRVDRAVKAREWAAERELAQALLAHDAAGVARQHFEHVELGERQRQRPPAPLGAAPRGRDDQRPDLDDIGVRLYPA